MTQCSAQFLAKDHKCCVVDAQKALRIEHRSHEQAMLKQNNLQVGCRTCEMWEGMSGMLSPALLATLITISEGPPEDRKQASLIETHLPELMM